MLRPGLLGWRQQLDRDERFLVFGAAFAITCFACFLRARDLLELNWQSSLALGVAVGVAFGMVALRWGLLVPALAFLAFRLMQP